jgi:hypothetical protein
VLLLDGAPLLRVQVWLVSLNGLVRKGHWDLVDQQSLRESECTLDEAAEKPTRSYDLWSSHRVLAS